MLLTNFYNAFPHAGAHQQFFQKHLPVDPYIRPSSSNLNPGLSIPSPLLQVTQRKIPGFSSTPVSAELEVKVYKKRALNLGVQDLSVHTGYKKSGWGPTFQELQNPTYKRAIATQPYKA